MEVLQFSPHVVMGHIRASGVRAQAHGDVVCQALLRALYDAVEDHLPIVALHFRHMADRRVK